MNIISEIRKTEVLKYKIDLDEKQHEEEKNKLLLEQEKERHELENVIDVLKDRTIDQEDKICQLDQANCKKDKKIEQLKRKEEKMIRIKEELLGKISILEEQVQSSTETCEKQQNEIKRLGGELSRVENELQVMKYDNQLQDNAINGLTAEIKLQQVAMNTHLNSITKQLDNQSKESAKMAAMLENMSVAKESVNIQTAQHVTLSLNQKGGRTGMCADRKAVPVKIFNPQIRSTGNLSNFPGKRSLLNRKNQQKAE